MAWPPPVLPTNRTNATPQLDTHVSDHNAANLAINDLVTRLQSRAAAGLEYTAGYVTSGAVTMPAFGVVDAVSASLGAAPWPVRVHVHLDAWFGYSGSYVNGHADLYRFVDGAVIASPTPVQAVAAAWALASVDHSWTVGTGADMAFKCRYFADGGGGGAGWYDVRATYSVTNL